MTAANPAIYLQPRWIENMDPELFGLLTTWRNSVAQRHLEFWPWGGDNRAFVEELDEPKYWPWLARMVRYQATCLFIAVPDVVGNCTETLRRFIHYAPRIKRFGFPVALVAQDGLERVKYWPKADTLFIGGSDDWKESAGADLCIQRAKERGMRVHVGRVNSDRRFRHFNLVGMDSCDGTFVTFGGDANWQRMKHWPLQSPLGLKL